MKSQNIKQVNLQMEWFVVKFSKFCGLYEGQVNFNLFKCIIRNFVWIKKNYF